MNRLNSNSEVMSTHYKRWVWISKLVLIVISFLTVNLATAESLNRISGINGLGGAGCGTDPGFSITSANSKDFAFNSGTLGCGAFGRALAGGGVVGIQNTLGQSPAKGPGIPAVATIGTQASSTIYDLYLTPDLTGIPGSDDFTDHDIDRLKSELQATYGASIAISVNMAISGEVAAAVDTNASFTRGASASLESGVRINNGSLKRYDKSVAVTNSTSSETETDPFDGTFVATATINWVQPFSVSMYINGRSSVSGYGDSTTTASVNALNSLSFATSGPVFNLPEGFTINSVEANIVNNRWIDPRTVPANQAPNGVIDTPADNIEIIVGETVNFTATGTDVDNNFPLDYLWTFSTGSGVADIIVEDPGNVTFDNPGVFTVIFSVTDNLGLTDPTVSTITVTVNAPILVSPNPIPTLSEWSVMILSIILFIVGFREIRRKHKKYPL